jgi:hypothetical protein
MALRWILGLVRGSGLWGYLTSRDQNKSQIELAKVHVVETKELIKDLPYGAVYREGTRDGWREIHMPPAPQLFVMPVRHDESERESSKSAELPSESMALDQGEGSGPPDSLPPADTEEDSVDSS